MRQKMKRLGLNKGEQNSKNKRIREELDGVRMRAET
jgi:hypothetical protein